MNNLVIRSAKFVDCHNTAIDLVIYDSESDVYIPYGYIIGSDDGDAPISQWIKSLLSDHAECLHIEPYDGPTELEINSAIVREKRDGLLSDTDKYMVIDYPISDDLKLKIKEYRQQLRDLPSKEGFPNNVVWPEFPEITNISALS